MVQCAHDVVALTLLSVAVHEGALILVPADKVIAPRGALDADTLTAITVRPTKVAPAAGVRNTTFVESVGTVRVKA